MFGTVHFYDDHTEPIINYQFNPTDTELYFTTSTGQYGFKNHIKASRDGDAFLYRYCSFYKYDKQWLATPDIAYVELFTEVFTDD